jgi:DNA modification methylase
VLAQLPSDSVDCCVTSPPYWGLRNYDTEPTVWGGDAACLHFWLDDFCTECGAWRGSLGLEPTPELYTEHIVQTFREVFRVLKPTGTLWLVIGDSYAGSSGSYRANIDRDNYAVTGWTRPGQLSFKTRPPTASIQSRSRLKNKDLVGIPWMVALALRDAGWYLRCDIIWEKPNATPESAKDRPCRSHEYVFLLTKSPNYAYDRMAIREPSVGSASNGGNNTVNSVSLRNRRSVWTVPTQPFHGQHFATFPSELVRPCIRAGCPESGVVLDPFMGAGTTALVALQENRSFVGIEMNPHYTEITEERLRRHGYSSEGLPTSGKEKRAAA